MKAINKNLNNTEAENSEIKKVTLFHDLSSFGRCALSVITPIIVLYGLQPIQIPTSLLSTHTGGFDDFTMLDLTEEMQKIINHHIKLNIKPCAIYSGFLGSEKQIDIISDYIKHVESDDICIIIDPVMADDGKLYPSYNNSLKEKMSELVYYADITTPNITEAFFLAGMDYKEPPYDEKIISVLFDRLEKYNVKDIIITSVEFKGNKYGVAYKNNGIIEYFFCEKLPVNYPGSGDIFTSVLCGEILNGATTSSAVKKAMNFLYYVILRTYKKGSEVREGLLFEDALSYLF